MLTRLAAIACLAAACPAQFVFTQPGLRHFPLDNAQSPWTALGDFDGDGDLDAVGAVSSQSTSTSRFYRNDGNGVFRQDPAWPDVPSAFHRFEFLAHQERFVRGLIVLASVAALIVLRLGQRPRSPDVLPDGSGIDGALADAAAFGRSTNALLVATGDKALFRCDAVSGGFITYRTSGRFLVAWSDPVGPPGKEREIIAAFVEHAADWDREAVLDSVARCSKALVLHEDTKTGGFGAEIAATIAEEAFEQLDAPVRRVAAPDTPVPFAPTLEKAFIPQVDDVVAALRDLAAY